MGGVTTGDGVEIIDGGDMVDEVVDMDVGPETSVVADTILWSWAEGVCDTVGVDVVTSVGGDDASSFVASSSLLISNVLL